MKDIEQQHVMVIFLNNKILGNGPGITGLYITLNNLNQPVGT
jgi:hypothetical protein